MRRPHTQRKCKHCQTFFAPDPRSARRQRYCAKLACRQASKAASQHRWLQKPGNRDYFTGPTHVERVRQWRQAHPGSWRRQGARTPNALQEDLTSQAPQKQPLEGALTPYALQDAFFTQPAVVVGLIAHLADPGKFESERLCSYNRGTTRGDVGCLYFCSTLFWRPPSCGPSHSTSRRMPSPP